MIRYFISDLHLSDKRLDLIQAFVYLVDEWCQRAKDEDTQVYILGDFFEAYIGDDYQPEWMATLDQQLRRLHESGVSVFFIAGNRDFLVGEAWFERTKVTSLPEQSVIDQCLMLTHGDEFCIDDAPYQEFRAMVRQPAWQQQVLAMPLSQRIELAQKLRNDSKTMSADKADAIMDVNQAEIERVMPSKVSCLIHGHTHRPALHLNGNIPRLVLGDWDTKVWVAVQSDHEFTQRHIDAQTYLEAPTSLYEWPIVHRIPVA